MLAERRNSREAIPYFLRAISFPFHLEYAKEFIDSYNSLGELFYTSSLYASSFLMCRQGIVVGAKIQI
jgi:hypothetical protein